MGICIAKNLAYNTEHYTGSVINWSSNGKQNGVFLAGTAVSDPECHTYLVIPFENENVISISEEKRYNLNKLDQIASLKDGWNGGMAKAFSDGLISKTREIITRLKFQPEVFPTACDSIQIEYEQADGAYLEIDLKEEKTWDVYEIDHEHNEHYYTVSADVFELNRVVKQFYE